MRGAENWGKGITAAKLQRPKKRELPVSVLLSLGDVSGIHLCDYSPFLGAE